MVMTESVTINVPVGMSKYLNAANTEMELTRNDLLLYPYIKSDDFPWWRSGDFGNQKIRAARSL